MAQEDVGNEAHFFPAGFRYGYAGRRAGRKRPRRENGNSGSDQTSTHSSAGGQSPHASRPRSPKSCVKWLPGSNLRPECIRRHGPLIIEFLLGTPLEPGTDILLNPDPHKRYSPVRHAGDPGPWRIPPSLRAWRMWVSKRSKNWLARLRRESFSPPTVSPVAPVTRPDATPSEAPDNHRSVGLLIVLHKVWYRDNSPHQTSERIHTLTVESQPSIKVLRSEHQRDTLRMNSDEPRGPSIRGRSISLPDRQQAVTLMQEAKRSGARLARLLRC